MRKRKIPLRKCVGCGDRKPKKELIRIVKNKDGELNVDITGKANGRGAYICCNKNCLKKAKKRNSIANALKIEITDEIYDKLAEEISNIDM